MASRVIQNFAKRTFLRALEAPAEGFLEVVCPGATYKFGNPTDPLRATLAVHDERFFVNAISGGDIGVGESFTKGDWSTPDLVALVRFGVRSLDRLEEGSRIAGLARRVLDIYAHRRKGNSRSGSRRNIAYHYDLGNDFYRLFLDRSMAYSCAVFEAADDTLELAQYRKFDRICRKLSLGPNDHLLEIGTGWGGFAAFAVENYGCRITTTTISREQHDFADDLFKRSEFKNRIELLCEDYRNLSGRYDKIVSIEMFEAVGLDHYDDYFSACDRLLESDGSMLLQTITMREDKFRGYRRRSDWIKKYIFPGSELASVEAIIASLRRCTRMQLFHLEDIGMHYALTLREWRRRFLAEKDRVAALGFDGQFIRMWEYYLAYCEAAFLERYIGDVQLVLGKHSSRLRLKGEPSEQVVFGQTDLRLV